MLIPFSPQQIPLRGRSGPLSTGPDYRPQQCEHHHVVCKATQETQQIRTSGTDVSRKCNCNIVIGYDMVHRRCEYYYSRPECDLNSIIRTVPNRYKVAVERSAGQERLEPTAICNYATFVFKQRKDPVKAQALFAAGLERWVFALLSVVFDR